MSVAPSNAATSAPAPEARKDRYRVSSLLVKKTGMTDEEFFTYWRDVHGPLFAGLEIVKKNLIKYEQVSDSSTMKYYCSYSHLCHRCTTTTPSRRAS